MNTYRPSGRTPITLNFLIINVLMYLVKLLFQYKYDMEIAEYLGLRYFMSDEFHWYQIFTYMFVHGNETHLFFNMIALWMFGPLLEQLWGSKRFVFYYVLCGVSAALTQYGFYYFKIESAINELNTIHNEIMQISQENIRESYLEQWMEKLSEVYDSMIIIGASGSIYGLLGAYGILFPNTYFYVYFIMPLKAKWFVIIFSILELIMGVFLEDNVAHFAHLGGMVIGIIWVWWWKKRHVVYF